MSQQGRQGGGECSPAPGARRGRGRSCAWRHDSGDSNQALAKAQAASSLRDRRIIFRTDQVLALRLKNYQVMSILLDELQTGRDAQPGEAGLIMHYALWLASCAR